MIEIAMKMLFCLLIAAVLGGIIGYLLGRISKCESDLKDRKRPLYDYDQEEQLRDTPHQEVFATIPDATIKKSDKGIKPITLAAPIEGKADDLKQISGIGIKVENTLYELGIFHFSQIAEWTKENVRWIENFFDAKGRVEREAWIEQAKHLLSKIKE